MDDLKTISELQVDRWSEWHASARTLLQPTSLHWIDISEGIDQNLYQDLHWQQTDKLRYRVKLLRSFRQKIYLRHREDGKMYLEDTYTPKTHHTYNYNED